MDGFLSALLIAVIVSGIWYLIAMQSNSLVPWLLGRWKKAQDEHIRLQRQEANVFVKKRVLALKRAKEILRED